MQLPPLQEAHLLRRYRRFLADVQFSNGREVTVHCPNTGAMTGCAEPGSRVWLTTSDNPRRKYCHGWELVETAAGELACIHSARANALVREAVERGLLPPFRGMRCVQNEVRYPAGGRADLLLEGGQGTAGSSCLVEVKSVTLCLKDGLGIFPDAPSERARRHLRSLQQVRAAGRRAALVFCVQHNGIRRVAPADEIDPAYGAALREALAAGVEIIACRARVGPQEINVEKVLPVLPAQP